MATDQNNKPVLDEQTFEKLLEAAYVMQEHNRKMRELEKNLESQSEQLREQELAHQVLLQRTKPKSEDDLRSDVDYTLTLAQIVEAQHQIQIRHLELDKAMAVVAERVARITNASGAAIGILEGKNIRYRAGAGPPALPAGSEVPLRTAICQANVRTGQVIRSEDVNIEILFDPEPCLQRGILSLVAVPIYHDGDIVGALELYFDRPHGFAEQDIHTCQLMGGLVTEAIGRDTQSSLKKSMATERSTMLAAIERLKPDPAARSEDRPGTAANPEIGAGPASAKKIPCWKCGSGLLAEEQFCGKCGVARAGDTAPTSMQSKVASALQMRQINRDEGGFSDGQPDPVSAAEPEGDPTASYSAPDQPDQNELSLAPYESANQSTVAVRSTALVVPQDEDIVWSSAAKARDFLESVSGTHASGALARFWRSRRGDFYLAFALILVAVVIRWGIWSESSVGATGKGSTISGRANRRRQISPDADLSAFDKMLISFGLAEAPEASEYKGNPEVQVWVDLHTALYYCPGADLYGKTPKGKVTSQRDAQLDQFEPASRKACD